MNVSPEKNIEGANTEIAVMAIAPITNKLDKDQKNGDATKLHCIKDKSIDFICTHPPYADIIKYSKGISGDISLLCVDKFLDKMNKVAAESYRVLKKGKICAVMIGDVRKHGKVIP